MSSKIKITTEVADPTQGMASIMESVQSASSRRAERLNERLVGESLSAPFDAVSGDLKADAKLFASLTNMALENAKKLFDTPMGRPIRENIEVNQIEGVSAPTELNKTLTKMGRQASVDIRIFPESGGICVVGTWTPDAKGNGTIYPYTIHEAIQEKRVYTFNDGGKKYTYEASTVTEAQLLFDKEVPLDERFGEPDVNMEYIRETADFDSPFQVIQIAKSGAEKSVGSFDSPRRAFQKLAEMYHNDLSGKIIGKSGNTWLATKTQAKELGSDPFEPVKTNAGLTREDFQFAETSGKKILIGVSSKNEGVITGNLGAINGKGLKIGSVIAMERIENDKNVSYFGHVLDISEALVFAEMSDGKKIAPNDKKAAIKLNPASYTDHKDKSKVM